MAPHFVSSADGSDANDGHTLDTPWATYKYAVESGGLTPLDSVIMRPTHSETPTADVNPIYSGTDEGPIFVVGVPRAAHAISSSDWTNGSASVTNDDADMLENKHEGRHITGPDGETYIITRVVSTTSFTIDREYAGSTVTNNGTASIQADPTFDDWENYDDSGDTTKKTDWEGSDNRPLIDFNDGAFQIIHSSDYNYVYQNIEFKDSTDTNGIISLINADHISFLGCLFKQSTSNTVIFLTNRTFVYFERCIIKGSGSGSNQAGLVAQVFGASPAYLKDCAIYNCGDHGMNVSGPVVLENVNIGVEQSNGDDDISFTTLTNLKGRDVKLGGSNGYVVSVLPNCLSKVSLENYQKILGDHRTYYAGGYFERVAISGETPNKKVFDYAMKITPNVNFNPAQPEWAICLLTQEFEVTADSHTFGTWIYNDSGVTLNDATAKDDIFMKVEFIKAYDDTSEYVISESFSTQIDILDAADANDWDELTASITTDTTGKVRVTIYLRFYSATGNIFVEPVRIS
jgi:hypothetical protein